MVSIFQVMTTEEVMDNGYGRQVRTYRCVPVSATRINELMDKVKESAKAIGANLICGGTIESHDGPNDKWHTASNPRDTCYVYFYGPAYHYT